MHSNDLEYEGIEGTEKAGSESSDRAIDFPTGRDLEEAEDNYVNVQAHNLVGDDFKYHIRYDWKVTYV